MLGAGLAVGILLLAAIRLLIEPAVPEARSRIAASATLPVWRRLGIMFVAAIGEELLFRLVLLCATVAMITRLVDRAASRPGRNLVRSPAESAQSLPGPAGRLTNNRPRAGDLPTSGPCPVRRRTGMATDRT